MKIKVVNVGTSLAVQWLRLRASTAGVAGSISGRGTKIPHATQPPVPKKVVNVDKALTRVHGIYQLLHKCLLDQKYNM